jgi:hypothetical protein
MIIDWTCIPKHTINCGKLNDPFDISIILKQFKVRKYLYRIVYKGIVIKFGMSADNSRNFGERIYRQIGHCKSWDKKRLNGSSGSDWRIIEEEFFNLYGLYIDHKFITITIYDVTKYPFQTISPWDEIISIENSLIEDYVAIVGEKPIGNINDESNIKRRPKILKTTWDGIFGIG